MHNMCASMSNLQTGTFGRGVGEGLVLKRIRYQTTSNSASAITSRRILTTAGINSFVFSQ